MVEYHDSGNAFTLTLSPDDTHEWAHETKWPCSVLAGRSLDVTYDTNGLLDRDCEDPLGHPVPDIPSDELNAIVEDHLSGKADTDEPRMSSDHPCWFVAVGQFQG